MKLPAVGSQLPELRVRFTRETLARYAGAATDFNPIHYSDFAARALQLPGVIAHGMLTMGTALRVVTDWCADPTRVRSWYARFTAPVVVPDDADGVELVITGQVTEVSTDGPEPVAVVEVEVRTTAAPSAAEGKTDTRVLRGGRARVAFPA